MRVEDGVIKINTGKLIAPEDCNNNGCEWNNSDVSGKIDWVFHDHVRSNFSDKRYANLIDSKRPYPGPGDHYFLVVEGVANYYRWEDGTIRVLEYYDNSYQIRTIRGAPLKDSTFWTPSSATPTRSEIRKAMRK